MKTASLREYGLTGNTIFDSDNEDSIQFSFESTEWGIAGMPVKEGGARRAAILHQRLLTTHGARNTHRQPCLIKSVLP